MKGRLLVDRLDVWRIDLDIPPQSAEELAALTDDEIVRTRRFHREQDRVRFSRCRSALRCILSRYLAFPAHDIRFAWSQNGKPGVIRDQNPSDLQFNVSHSGEIALVGVCLHRPLGIDIEKIREDVEALKMAERFFTVRERTGLLSLGREMQLRGFFACWTRKEAFVKATGEGLSLRLSDFSVSTHPDLNPRVDEIQGDSAAAEHWFLQDLAVREDFRAAIAAPQAAYEVTQYSLNAAIEPYCSI